MNYQDLSKFRVPPGFRGRSGWFVQLWWLARALLFSTSPQVLYGWRVWLLRCFGARIGKGVIIRPSVRITYPWFLTIGDHAWVGDGAEIYNLAPIEIGEHAVISQGCYLCTGTHDFECNDFAIQAHPIRIGAQSWLASQVFVMPGIQIGAGAVVGVRSMVTRDLPPGTVCWGSPARVIRVRECLR
ncbi:putative colanic acid biosynthesis acetyltransferase [Asticcacaulis sp. W401b]|uniref:putative colanic acid biosynthesis acetyltransferase n=1 Tax=Asticcacaulis sp. W401b TaxID=3388666 RepID=UPI0039709094